MDGFNDKENIHEVKAIIHCLSIVQNNVQNVS